MLEGQDETQTQQSDSPGSNSFSHLHNLPQFPHLLNGHESHLTGLLEDHGKDLAQEVTLLTESPGPLRLWEVSASSLGEHRAPGLVTAGHGDA